MNENSQYRTVVIASNNHVHHVHTKDSHYPTFSTLLSIYLSIYLSTSISSIFEIAPQVHGMFRFARDFEPGSDELYQSERFMLHATGVISTVDTAVSLLAPDLDPLTEILNDLGQKHAQYGALPAHYAVVGRALIDTLQTVLGDRFTSEIKTAWARIYDIVSTSMIEGAEEAYDDDFAIGG